MNPDELNDIRSLLPRLPQPAQQKISALLRRREAGEDVEIDIIDALNEHPAARQWLKERSDYRNQLTTRGYIPPGGDIGEISASARWVCPEEGCTETLPVLIEGEDPPECPVHHVKMTRRQGESHAR